MCPTHLVHEETILDSSILATKLQWQYMLLAGVVICGLLALLAHKTKKSRFIFYIKELSILLVMILSMVYSYIFWGK